MLELRKFKRSISQTRKMITVSMFPACIMAKRKKHKKSPLKFEIWNNILQITENLVI